MSSLLSELERLYHWETKRIAKDFAKNAHAMGSGDDSKYTDECYAHILVHLGDKIQALVTEAWHLDYSQPLNIWDKLLKLPHIQYPERQPCGCISGVTSCKTHTNTMSVGPVCPRCGSTEVQVPEEGHEYYQCRQCSLDRLIPLADSFFIPQTQ